MERLKRNPVNFFELAVMDLTVEVCKPLRIDMIALNVQMMLWHLVFLVKIKKLSDFGGKMTDQLGYIILVSSSPARTRSWNLSSTDMSHCPA